jgi:hypothetical protein
MPTVYDTSLEELTYTNDAEYRETIRRLFCMISPKDMNIDDLDEITRDEQDFDPEATESTMNEIYDKTKGNPLFQHLYDSAAAKMISMDRSIGLAVLCSYDYLALFHKCLCLYLKRPNEFNEQSDEYVRLMKKIT